MTAETAEKLPCPRCGAQVGERRDDGAFWMLWLGLHDRPDTRERCPSLWYEYERPDALTDEARQERGQILVLLADLRQNAAGLSDLAEQAGAVKALDKAIAQVLARPT